MPCAETGAAYGQNVDVIFGFDGGWLGEAPCHD